MENYQYKAFISYRHTSVDQDIAKRLHTLLENYKIPSTLKKSLGISKIGRIFRDNEELPLSADLGEDIHKALEISEWLICVCSPRFIESKWCSEEVNYFLSLGRRDHILTILVEGEPQDAFPEALRFVTVNGQTIEKEPLAADVRASSIKDSLKKLESEKLRLLAPILGVNFDDLKQRARKRRIKIITTIITAAFLLLSSFLTYTIIKNKQIENERNIALISQSKYLAKSANDILDSKGDRLLATLLSIEALPEDFNHPNRPVAKEALFSLRSSLISGTSENYVKVTDFNNSIKSFRADGNILAVSSDDIKNYITAYDLRTGNEIDFPISLDKRPYQCVFSKDLNTILYTDSTGINRIKLVSGNIEKTNVYNYQFLKDEDYPIATDDDCEGFAFTQSGYYVETHKYIEGANNDVAMNNSFRSIYKPVIFPSNEFRDENRNETVYLTSNSNWLYLIKADNFTERFDENVIYTYKTSSRNYYDNSIFSYYPSYNGNNVIAISYDAVYIWNTFTTELVKTISYEEFDGSEIYRLCVSSANSKVAIITKYGNLYVYDYETNEKTCAQLGNYKIKNAHFSSEGDKLICFDNNNCFVITSGGYLLQAIDTEFDLQDAAYVAKDAYGNASDDTYILLQGKNMARLYTTSETESSILSRVKDNSIIDPNKAKISSDGKEIWYFSKMDDVAYLNVYNISSNQTEQIKELSIDVYNNLNNLVCINDRYTTLSGKIDEKAAIVVFDTISHKELFTINPCVKGVSFIDQTELESDEFLVTPAYITEDGKYVIYKGMLNEGNHLTSKGDQIIMVYDTKSFEEKYSFLEKYHWEYIFEEDNDNLIINCGFFNGELASTRYKAEIIDMKSWKRIANAESFFAIKYLGILDNCELDGFSDAITAYVYDGQTHFIDMKDENNQKAIDLDGIVEMKLSEDKKGILLYSTASGGKCYLYDGIDYKDFECDLSVFNIKKGNIKYNNIKAYFEDGILYQNVDNEKIIDFRNEDIEINGTDEKGNVMLLNKGNKLYVLKCLQGNDLLNAAKDTLNQRELNQEEKEKYFIE